MKKLLLLSCTVLLCCVVLSPLHAATKAEQVERYLGSYRFKNDRPLGTVKFVFQQAVLKRQGDGKKTYEQLLFNERYFSNRDNAGRLIGIQVVHKDKTVTIQPESPKKLTEADVSPPKTKPSQKARAAPAPEPEPAARMTRVKPKTVPATTSVAAVAPTLVSDPVRPRQNVPPPALNKDKGISLPDSLTMVRNIEEAKEQITGWKGRMWQTVRPAWEFVMWVFSSIIVMLVCFAGVCRYVAKTAATESLINSYGRIIVGRWIVSAHQNAAAMLLVITWIIAIVLLLDVFMWLVYLDLPIWTLLVIWFPILWVAEKLTSWIVPNIPVVGPGGNHH